MLKLEIKRVHFAIALGAFIIYLNIITAAWSLFTKDHDKVKAQKLYSSGHKFLHQNKMLDLIIKTPKGYISKEYLKYII